MGFISVLLAITLIVYYLWHKWTNGRALNMLKDVPGPFIIPFVGSVPLIKPAGNTNIMSKVNDASQIYGPHVKVFVGNEAILLLSDPSDIKTFVNHPESLYKPELIYQDFTNILGNGLATANGKIWHNHRKVLYKAFNTVRINTQIGVLQKQAESLVLALSTSTSSNIDLEPIIYKHSLTVNAENFFGCCFDEKVLSEVYKMNSSLSEIIGLKLSNPLHRSDWLFYLTALARECKTLFSEARTFAEKVIDQGKLKLKNANCNGNYSTVVDMLLKSTMSKQDLVDEILTITATSTNTTTVAISSSLVLLALHPAVQDKLLEELLRVLGPEQPVDTENVKYLEYTEMVILETLRLFPIGPFFGRRNPSDVQLSYFTVPADTTVLVNVFNIHRNEKYWPDPLAFKPERFSPENSSNRNSDAFMPFATGPRKCPGARYAMLQATVFLANLIRRYKVSTSYQSVEDVQLSFSIILHLVHGAKCTLEKRNEYSLQKRCSKDCLFEDFGKAE